MVVVCCNCRQIVMFERNETTGELSSVSTTQLNDATVVGTGAIVGMAISDTKLFVSTAASSADSRILVLDFDYCFTPSPTFPPPPTPTAYPSLAPTPAPTPAEQVCR